MMANGRPPKPTALKLLQGTDRGDRMNADEPKPPVALLPAPPHLTAAAKAEYRRLGKQLVAQRVMTVLDRNALAVYCTAWARAVDAAEKLAKYGDVISGQKGELMPSPYLRIYRGAVEHLATFGPMFGLDPSSRTRIRTGVPPEMETELDRLIREG